MSETNLLKDLISATGLPEDGVEKELSRLLLAADIKPEEITLEELRELLANYMQEVLVSAKNEFSA